MKIQESAQNYLEQILMISKKQEKVHAIDIGNAFGFSRPTVSEMLKALKKEEFIEVDAENHITLTDKGRQIAEKMFERHHIIAEIFISIGVDAETAYDDACRVEHYISDKTFRCMKEHLYKKPTGGN